MLSIKGRAGRVGALTCGFLVTLAAPAVAATVRATPSIKGAGTVAGNHAGYSCSSGNQDERQTKTDCAQSVKVEDWHPFGIGMSLTATPSTYPSGRWEFVRWEGCESTSGEDGQVCNVGAPGGGSATWAPRAIFSDDDNPTITSGPTEWFLTDGERRVQFFFGANETDSTYTCRFDGAAFAPCASGDAFTVAAGARTFDVRAYDPSGQPSGIASRTIRAIDTTLNGGGPSGLTSSRTATFSFSTAGGTGFECSLNSTVAYSDCSGGSKTYAGLADGSYVFRVRGKADGGWYDRLPAIRSFTVDGTAPDTALAALPETPGEGAASTLTTAVFGFSASEPGTFECSLDGAAFAACTTPLTLTGLDWGPHSLRVRAKDAAGNLDGSPATRHWTVLAPDADADGYRADVDCDDADGAVNPGRGEVLDNAVDEDCDGVAGVELDRDGDGAKRPADCDDADPNVRPGAAEVPGNGIDEDCRGGDARAARPTPGPSRPAPAPAPAPAQDAVIDVVLSHSSKAFKRFTRFGELSVKNVPNGATVVAKCKVKRPGKKARKCRGKARKAFERENAFGTVALAKLVRVKLRVGTLITVTVTRPGAVGAVKKVKIRRRKAPRFTTLCLQPGARKPTAC